MDLGFIGLGHMGAPMARNLLKASHHLIVYNRTRSDIEALSLLWCAGRPARNRWWKSIAMKV
ncbi:hypothetical protein BJA01nite_85640 [Bradyrhizobium japonicum]|nr:hypothetical protein BJA01nite_85640 [Bradyrhizobium japonicum]